MTHRLVLAVFAATLTYPTAVREPEESGAPRDHHYLSRLRACGYVYSPGRPQHIRSGTCLLPRRRCDHN